MKSFLRAAFFVALFFLVISRVERNESGTNESFVTLQHDDEDKMSGVKSFLEQFPPFLELAHSDTCLCARRGFRRDSRRLSRRPSLSLHA